MRKRLSLVPVAIFIIFFLLLNVYALSGLKILAPQAYVPTIFWVAVGAIVILSVTAVVRLQSREPDKFFTLAIHVFLMFFASELLFVAVLLIDDSYRLLASFFTNLHFQPRPVVVVEIAVALFLFLFFAFLYGMLWGKYAYRVIKHTLYFDDLPKAFDGFTITQISDVHAGSFTNPKEVQKGIDLIHKQQSDLFVFTGDLVNNKAEEIKPYIGHFSQIKAKYGQFSILGNHDYGDYVRWENDLVKQGNLQQLKKYHQELGFRLLLDEHLPLEKDGEKIILAGIENWGKGFGERGDLKKALVNTQTDDFKVLLSHDPSHWEEQVKNNPSKIHLTLSGHTHGMQFGIELFGIKWSPVSLRYKHWAGVKEENGRVLNVNRGFGFIGFSGRVGIWPEVTVIELKRK
jgi:predicted MPP superfamily phosphohydrolase